MRHYLTVHQIFKNFLISFAGLFVLFFASLSIIFELKLAAILGGIVSFILSLSVMGYTRRALKSQRFEVNMQNKMKERGMRWYEERIREQIFDHGFTFSHKEDNGEEVFSPRTLYQVYEPDIKLRVDTYSIEFEASRLMVRIISDYLEIPIEKGESF